MSEPFTITLPEFSTPQHDFCVTGILEQDEHEYYYPVIELIYLWDSLNSQKIWLWSDDKNATYMLNMMEDWKVFSMEELKYNVRKELGM